MIRSWEIIGARLQEKRLSIDLQKMHLKYFSEAMIDHTNCMIDHRPANLYDRSYIQSLIQSLFPQSNDQS